MAWENGLKINLRFIFKADNTNILYKKYEVTTKQAHGNDSTPL